MKRALAGRAADTYVLASSEKIGTVSAYKVLELRATTAILTDAVQNDALDALRHAAPAIIECA
jgi:DeoR/GlpR family transcriptional regulator of sugar metabolism